MKTLKNINGFQETKEMVTITFDGWDGKSYNGEGRNMRVWMMNNEKFVKASYLGSICFHKILDEVHPISGINQVEYFTHFDIKK